MPLTRRQIYRRRRLAVFGTLTIVLGGLLYLPMTLLAPVPATATPVDALPAITSEPASLAWPSYGASAIEFAEFGGLSQSAGSDEPRSIASISKVVTALVVLDAHPLEKGEKGPTIAFDGDDIAIYYDYIARGGKVEPVAAGMELTQLQVLRTMLMASANNYAESLAVWGYGSVPEFARAADEWLDDHGLTDTTIVEPSGMNPANRSTTADLIDLAEIAMGDPVVAALVGTKTASVPGVGDIRNGNKLLGSHGVIGLKTGTLDEAGACLLFAAEIPVDDTTVTVYGVVLGGPDHDVVDADVVALLESVAAGFRDLPLSTAGTPVTEFTTPWGSTATVETATDASVTVWGEHTATVTAQVAPVGAGAAGDAVGHLTVSIDGTDYPVALTLADDLEGPDIGWRLAHPFALLG